MTTERIKSYHVPITIMVIGALLSALGSLAFFSFRNLAEQTNKSQDKLSLSIDRLTETTAELGSLVSAQKELNNYQNLRLNAHDKAIEKNTDRITDLERSQP